MKHPPHNQISSRARRVVGNIRMFFRVTYTYYDKLKAQYFVRGTVSGRDKRNQFKGATSIKVNVDYTLSSIPAKGEYWQVIGLANYYTEEKHTSVLRILHFKDPSTFNLVIPTTHTELSEFVSKSRAFPNIGASRIYNIWEMYREDSLQIILDGQIEKLEAVDLMTRDNALTLVEGFKKYKNLQYADWFAEHNIPPMVQQAFFKTTYLIELNNRTRSPEENTCSPLESIADNPYQLVTLGMDFSDVDKMALNTQIFNKPNDDKHRLVAAVNQVLTEYVIPHGHTFAYHKQIFGKIFSLLGDSFLAKQALKQAEKMLNFRRGDEGTYHHGNMYLMECLIAKRITTLLSRRSEWTELHTKAVKKSIKEVPFPLNEKQSEAICSALKNEVSIISGGAGTGKTTVLRAIFNTFSELGYIVHGIALSGRAALRLSESIMMPTKTIARFLRDAPLVSIDSERNKLKHLIIIDESSMVDTTTMCQIITHTSPEVRLLIVGDHEQLAPIGTGKVLYDLIQSKVVPCVELDQVMRQDESTGIPEYAGKVRAGRIPDDLSFKNIYFHECSEDNIVHKCVNLYNDDQKLSQIISATRKGIWELNTHCQMMFNACSPQLTYEYRGKIIESNIRQFDPIIFTKNHTKLGIHNGLLGHLASTAHDCEGNYGGVKVIEFEQLIRLSPSLIAELQLAYAITLHKAQGSQFPIVIIALHKSSLIDRSWLYTAITRAEVSVHVVGARETFLNAINSGNKGHKRQTYLRQLIHKMRAQRSTTN